MRTAFAYGTTLVTWDTVQEAAERARIAYGKWRARPTPDNRKLRDTAQLLYEQMYDELRVSYASVPMGHCSCNNDALRPLKNARVWTDMGCYIGECQCGSTLEVQPR